MTTALPQLHHVQGRHPVQLRAEFILKGEGDLKEAWDYVRALRQVDQKWHYLDDVEVVAGYRD